MLLKFLTLMPREVAVYRELLANLQGGLCPGVVEIIHFFAHNYFMSAYFFKASIRVSLTSVKVCLLLKVYQVIK